jgi:hypothetical protein
VIYSNATSGALSPNGVTVQSLTYNVPGTTSTTVIAIATGWTDLASTTLPTGCNVVQNALGDISENALIAVCTNQAAGNYVITANTYPITTAISEAAYVFTPPTSITTGPVTSITIAYNSTATIPEMATAQGGTGNLVLDWTLNGASIGTGNTINLPVPLSAPGTYLLNVTAVDQGTTNPFSSTNTITITATGTLPPSTTTISNGGGGGGPGGGSSGGGGGGGGGGSGGVSKPTITNLTNGYNVSTVTQLDTFSLALCGTTLQVTENYISPTEAGVTINGQQYILTPNGATPIIGEQNGCTVNLLNISYIPIQQTIKLQFTQSTPLLSNLPAANTISQLNVSFAIGPKDVIKVNAGNYSSLVYIKRVQVTPQGAPTGYTVFSVFNISVNSTLNVSTISFTESYECGLTNLQPFIIQNGTWTKVNASSTNTTACTITFPIPADPIVALAQQAAAPTPVLKQPASTTISQVQPIIVITTPGTLQNAVSQATKDSIAAVLVLAGIMALVGGAYANSLYKKNKKSAYKTKTKKKNNGKNGNA